MKRLFFSFTLLCLFITAYNQESYSISKPQPVFKNNVLTIKYDIAGCGRNEFVDIDLILINTKGDTLKPRYITGDIGKMISCGFGKIIEWNLEKDNIHLDENIEVIIKGAKSAPQLSGIVPQGKKELTRGNVILSSAFVPGLGLKKASGKSVYFIFSGLVYGAAGASTLYYLKGNKNYSEYEKTTGSTADDYFTKSENCYNMSHYMLYAAAGAWVTNMVWSAIIPIKKDSVKKMNLTLTSTTFNDLLISAKWTF